MLPGEALGLSSSFILGSLMLAQQHYKQPSMRARANAHVCVCVCVFRDRKRRTDSNREKKKEKENKAEKSHYFRSSFWAVLKQRRNSTTALLMHNTVLDCIQKCLRTAG